MVLHDENATFPACDRGIVFDIEQYAGIEPGMLF
jgi:hypothetical protein